VDRAEALLLMARGRPDAAAELLDRVVAEQQALGTPMEVVRTLMASAEVQRRRRRRGAARSLLERARQISHDCGAAPWLERIDAELTRLEPARGRGGPLTRTEERITALVAGGATNRQVAVALSIGVATVESALSQIYRKLGVRSRSELARHHGTATTTPR
jgi:DNA-binding CsgD family transcriptional regulator